MPKEYIFSKFKINSQFELFHILILDSFDDIDNIKSIFFFLSKKCRKLVIGTPSWAFLISLIIWNSFKLYDIIELFFEEYINVRILLHERKVINILSKSLKPNEFYYFQNDIYYIWYFCHNHMILNNHNNMQLYIFLNYSN